MADKLDIIVTPDGVATITLPGGGLQQVRGESPEDAVNALKAAYGDRIGDVIQSNQDSTVFADYAASERQGQRDLVVTRTGTGVGIGGSSAAETGYDTADIQRYINSDANKSGPGYSSVEEYIDNALSSADRLLVGDSSAYGVFSEEEYANLTDKQKLAAYELMHQGSSDTGRSNGLSQKDKDWVLNNANDFKGAVISPNQQAVSTGTDPVLVDRTQATGSTGGSSGVVDTGGSTGGGATGTVDTGSDTGSGGTITGGNTGTDEYDGPEFTSTPNIGVVQDIYGEGQTGLTEQSIPTYTAGVGLQEKDFAQRALDQEQFFQPQTLEEQEAAGTAPTFENKMYRNRFGMTMYIQHINGVPSQPIPPGYYLVQDLTTQGVYQGGMIQGFNTGATVNPAFNFQPGGTVKEQDGVYVIEYPDGTFSQGYPTAGDAKAALDMGTANLGLPDFTTYIADQGYSPGLPGYDEQTFYDAYQSYISDPATLTSLQQQQQQQEESADPSTGAINQDQNLEPTNLTAEELTQAQRDLVAQTYAAPGGAVAAAPVDYLDPNAYGTVIESTAGQATGTAPMVTEDQIAQIESATTADVPENTGASTYDANQAYDDVAAATEGMTGKTMDGPTKEITGQTKDTSLIAGLDAATGESVDVTGAPTRELDTTEGASELITGTGVDQSKVIAAFGEGELQAASVQDEMAELMKQFEGGNTPPWAAGAMRKAMATMAQRGLGASSMAGEAIIQAAMESALPIAQIDAGNKQEMALFKGEMRANFLQLEFDQAFQTKIINAAKISEIANMNFNAEQQIALENSKAANTMELQNLTNKQALILAEAADLSQLDLASLSNLQQAQVQNAQNFLQIDMANLSNEQQTALLTQQSLINAIFSDQAATNAALQFNATSENQTTQFFANLAASVNQFNAAQMNAMKQFNADEVNSFLEFNANLQSQRELFNAANYLVVAQANAQWRQNLETINNAAANESNMDFAQTVNALTLKALDEIWQRERDIMDYSFTSSENAADRALSILLGDKKLESIREQIDSQEDQALGSLLTKIFFSSDAASIFGE